ncbi:50S ribosomal protein L4 [Cesiribacter sp. SM1]|uniref:50S ribosomal protein L4 n=1 Tax=Cesiribacter sp. SM1 TaxID=2861196 RepID=UPI001CD3D46A|nr:50S ribosomal protein L4 [Cesiribacter sp. SM1]
MEVAVLKQSGEDTGRKIALAESVFGIEPNDHAIYLDVKQYLANQRQGTHKSKERNEVAGSTRKIKKQKGTGGARAGSIKSPVFRGGGRIFGPRPRNYSFKLNKKVKQLARQSALAYKLKDNNISILESISFDGPKTKDYLKLLNGLSLTNKKTLLVLADVDQNVVLSSRNIKNAQVTTASNLNTYEIIKADTLIISEGAVQKLEEIYNSAS